MDTLFEVIFWATILFMIWATILFMIWAIDHDIRPR